ncbi:BadF/BadG/BcrA/BcrD ATPase family protein [Aliiglaciecola sp. CAU 1673]|uniref:N-acetylglucosamine kinase n=1 Tax=Aliiglaciecola sp. CAU 1673 TaxID=3032595 RepID=UPI0023DC884B|nr:BadF/BadG/BcrA/BcrD ATPase family protein [Aliiglaciecola sp. CAU 1673]MDF2179871.1 BadF/BadG/BcrA/BcrD ATPase family protein [Aliiglaciecola sp. CAU 1673]
MSQQPLYLGIDGGGSKCLALIVNSEGHPLGQGVAGPANPTHGLEQSVNAMLSATEAALDNAGLAPERIHDLIGGAGLAGLNLSDKYSGLLREWQHPFKQLHFTTDLHIACLGAHDGADGAVIIAGTGSCGMVQVGDLKKEFGGHGFLVGDQGSGAWLGINAVRQALLVLDGLLPPSRLGEAVLEQCGARSASELAESMAQMPPAAYGRLAPVVLELAHQNDPIATDLVYQGVDYLERLARRLLAFGPQRLSMIGGLSQALLPFFSQDIKQHIQTPLHPPQFGAIFYAKQQGHTAS